MYAMTNKKEALFGSNVSSSELMNDRFFENSQYENSHYSLPSADKTVTEDGFVETLSLLIKRTIEENNKNSESKSVIYENIEGIDLRDKYGDTGRCYTRCLG